MFPFAFSRAIHLVSAFWTLGLAILIFLDVSGRGLFNQPIPGTKEIIQNSVVCDHIPATAAGDLYGIDVAHHDIC